MSLLLRDNVCVMYCCTLHILFYHAFVYVPKWKIAITTSETQRAVTQENFLRTPLLHFTAFSI